MQPENVSRLKKIEGISYNLQAICKLALCIYVVGELVLIWGMLGGPEHDFMGGNYVHFHIHELNTRDRLIFGVLWTATAGIMFKAVFHLHQLLGQYSLGAIFTKESARQIRQWGFACVALGLIKFLWISVPQVVPAIHLVSATPVLGGLGTIITGLIILGFSWFTEMGVEMREEQELTV